MESVTEGSLSTARILRCAPTAIKKQQRSYRWRKHLTLLPLSSQSHSSPLAFPSISFGRPVKDLRNRGSRSLPSQNTESWLLELDRLKSGQVAESAGGQGTAGMRARLSLQTDQLLCWNVTPLTGHVRKACWRIRDQIFVGRLCQTPFVSEGRLAQTPYNSDRIEEIGARHGERLYIAATTTIPNARSSPSIRKNGPARRA
jgi:hypothetical protein